MILIFLILISTSSCYEYFIRYQTKDIPCTILGDNYSWIRCLINQSNPLEFHHKKQTTNYFNLELIVLSIENLTLPSNFFRNDNILSNHYNFILIDMTQDTAFKQLNILTNTFVNIFPRRIDFIISNCGLPILNIQKNSFSLKLYNQIFITDENRTRTVLLRDYFSQLCWISDRSFFLNDYTVVPSDMKSHKKQQLQLFINGLIFSTITSLTVVLMCLLRRHELDFYLNE